mgnify:CR=1 FL=1|tara:strand:- start:581 stop:991 length:411 start_codon:yes stop_codon:yes gene_type:complete
MFAEIGKILIARLNADSAFTTANGQRKISPVRIPQNAIYPYSIYEIIDVDNFMSKGSSLNSCNVSIRLATFAETYNTTYNQAKAAINSLDLYSDAYTEDGQAYLAKFSFESLSDEYHNSAEVFYKNINFNCLIIKN